MTNTTEKLVIAHNTIVRLERELARRDQEIEGLKREREEQSIFLVGGVNRDPLRHCVWGFFPNLERALSAAKTNETDIHEAGWYPFAVVVKATPGLAVIPENTWWFFWDSGRYREIEQPEWAKRYGWMGFPGEAERGEAERLRADGLEKELREAQAAAVELAAERAKFGVQRDEARAQIAELREALKPFADAGHGEIKPFKTSDFVRAAEAYQKTEPRYRGTSK